MRQSGLVQTVEDPVLGEMDQVGMAIGFSETPGWTRMPAPILGQHTAEVLASLDHTGNSSKESGNSTKSSKTPKHPLEGMQVLDFSPHFPYG